MGGRESRWGAAVTSVACTRHCGAVFLYTEVPAVAAETSVLLSWLPSREESCSQARREDLRVWGCLSRTVLHSVALCLVPGSREVPVVNKDAAPSAFPVSKPPTSKG